METVPVRGLFAVLDLEYPELSLISYVIPIARYLAFDFEPRSGTTQLYSQGKLTALKCENKKFDTKTKSVVCWV
jgi:hypothetical protein